MRDFAPTSNRPFFSTGLPDDFHAFMEEVLGEPEPLTEAELEELAAREASRVVNVTETA